MHPFLYKRGRGWLMGNIGRVSEYKEEQDGKKGKRKKFVHTYIQRIFLLSHLFFRFTF